MKLTKRVLAMILAAAMIVGMVAVGAYAAIGDYYGWDPDTNPYTAKIITKLYLVDKDAGTETAIEANASGKYEVAPGDLVRVETLLQTNYLAGGATLTPAYTNTIFVPTKNAANDYASYEYYQKSAMAKNLVFEYETAAPEGDRDGSFDGSPFLYGDAYTCGSGVVGAPYNALKNNYPIDWRGTGTAATNYLNADGFAQNLNILKIAFGAPSGDGYLAKGNGIIVVEPEVLFSYYLTVDANAAKGTTGFIGQPEANMVMSGNTAGGNVGTKNVANIPCYYVKDGYEYDTTSNALAVGSATSKKNAVSYIDSGATGDIVYVLENCDIIVVESHGGEEPPTPQVDKSALQTAIETLPTVAENEATSASWAAYADALAAAQDVYADAEATQDEVDAAALALTNATAGVTKLGDCDYTALDAAIAAYEALDLNAYTPASVTASDVAAKYDAAKAVARDLLDDEQNANQGVIDAAAQALNDAINALVAKADKGALGDAIAAAQAKNEADYTPASWTEADLENAIAAAQDVYADDNATDAQVSGAITALNEAIGKLAEKADKTALNAAIGTAPAVAENEATSASWGAYQAALTAAQAVAADDNAAQADVDKATTDLLAAIDGVTALAACDYAALDTAIAAYEALDLNAYTPASVTASDVVAKYDAAKAVARDLLADEAGVNQTAINDAASALADAIDALLEKANKDELNAAIADAQGKNEADYTPASWTEADLANVIADAQIVAADDNATAADVEEQIAAIEAAVAKLAVKADKSALAAAIDAASALSEADYTPASWTEADLANVIAAAQAVYDDGNATDDQISGAITALNEAIGKLAEKADKTALNQAIGTAPAVAEAEATSASWTAYQDALAAAQAVAADDNAAQADVDTAANNLLAAIDGVVALGACDYTALDAAIAAYEALDLNTYTPASVTASDVTAKYDAAKAVARDMLDDEQDVNQGVIDAAAQALNDAIAALAPKADKSALADAIAAAQAKGKDDYTPNSWNAADLENVIASAQGVYDDANADETAISGAITALNEAIGKLVEKADKTALNAAIGTAPAVAENEATSASWAAYQDALSAAQTIAADDNASQDDVDNAASALTTAINGVTKLADCDYTALDAAIADYEALDLNDYTPASVTASDVAAKYDAAKAVARDMLADEQGANQGVIDAAAQALNDAIDALSLKADKSALIAEIAAAPSMDEDTATDASWAAYQDALADAQDVVNDDNATAAGVSSAITDLVDAKDALTARDLCDYTALDTALALTPAEAQDAYTASTWAAYADAKAAAEGIARDLINNKAGTNQASINDAAAALTDAFNALKVSTSNVVSVDYDADNYFAKGTMTYTFKVNNAATKIQVINNETGATQTYDRYHAKVSIVSYNDADEEVDYATTEPAYELWTVDLTLAAGGYTVKAKYGKDWDAEGLEMNLEYATYEPTYTAVAKVGDGEFGKEVEIEAKHGSPVTFQVVTPTDVQKIQLALENGKTSTYTAENAVEDGDTLIWTVTRTFRAADVGACTVKTKSISGWTAADDAVITVSVAE